MAHGAVEEFDLVVADVEARQLVVVFEQQTVAHPCLPPEDNCFLRLFQRRIYFRMAYIAFAHSTILTQIIFAFSRHCTDHFYRVSTVLTSAGPAEEFGIAADKNRHRLVDFTLQIDDIAHFERTRLG